LIALLSGFEPFYDIYQESDEKLSDKAQWALEQ
jgi:hypothetical protein